MSEVLLLTIGAMIFAVTTIGSVIVGGLMFSRAADRQANGLQPAIVPVPIPVEAPPLHPDGGG